MEILESANWHQFHIIHPALFPFIPPFFYKFFQSLDKENHKKKTTANNELLNR